jgi:hypothetical protein
MLRAVRRARAPGLGFLDLLVALAVLALLVWVVRLDRHRIRRPPAQAPSTA